MQNLSWKDEFDRRLRRVVGCTDDGLPVQVLGGEGGICETCSSYDAYIEVTDPNDPDRIITAKGFESFPDLLNAVLAVEWVEVRQP